MYFLKYGFSIVFFTKTWYHIKGMKTIALHPQKSPDAGKAGK